ncbi:ABC transporter ATP-binding protein [Pseudonocardia sp. NPDC049635]|uniref:ABC transporter ATP-binding protein n=1 Tax=Pseudonocardia sp. NPDC049635 TaxID=3155506 RepID=UPI003405B616
MFGPVLDVLRPVRGRLAAGVALQAAGAAAGVVPFVAVADIGRLLLAGPVEPSALWYRVLVGALAALVALIATTAATTLTHLADNAAQHDLRQRIAAHLGRVEPGWFATRNSGQVATALQGEVHALHYLVAHTLLDVTAVLVTPLVAFGYLVTVDGALAVVALLPIIVGLVLFRRAMRGAGPQMAAYARARNEVNAGIVEFADGIAVVKGFGGGRTAHRRFVAACDAFHDFFGEWSRRTTSVTAASQLAVSPLPVLALLLVAGTMLVAAGHTDPAALIPFLLLGPASAAPVGAIGPRLQALRGGIAAATAIRRLLDEPVQAVPAQDAARPGTGAPPGTVTLDDVSFRYPGSDTDVLHGIDLELAPGTVTAVVGPSGAGKSTLAALLPRFHDVSAGAIRLGGVDVRELTPRTLYRQIGFVLQDVTLLRISVADNIALGRPEADRTEIEAAARAARIHDRTTALPHGYDTVLGEDTELSGGERQRVSIARALLADTPVLVLDEATAFADPDSEAAICDALSELASGRTVLVIAHRLYTVTGANTIVVLDEGRIVERGTHPELISAGGRYARMWAAQQGAPTMTTGRDVG